MPRIGSVKDKSNHTPSRLLGEAWEASQLGEILSDESRLLVEEGFHELFRGYYKRLSADPSSVTAKETSEFVKNIGIVLAEKVYTFNRLVAAKEEHIRVLESRELRTTPASEVLGNSTIGQTPTVPCLRPGRIPGTLHSPYYFCCYF